MNKSKDYDRYKDVKNRQDINVDNLAPGKSDKYEYENNTIIQRPHKFIDNYLISLIKNKKTLKLLDYCCGTGLRSLEPLKNGYDCYGVDISKKSIDVAKNRLGKISPSASNNYSVGNAENLNFKDNFFDVVISYGSFSYLDFEVAIEEVKRVLKKDGIFIILDTNKNNIIINAKRYLKFKNNIVSKYHIENLFDVKKIKKLENQYFHHSEIKYYFLFSILTIPLPENKIFRRIKLLSLILDDFFEKTFLKYFYWKFICILKTPID